MEWSPYLLQPDLPEEGAPKEASIPERPDCLRSGSGGLGEKLVLPDSGIFTKWDALESARSLPQKSSAPLSLKKQTNSNLGKNSFWC